MTEVAMSRYQRLSLTVIFIGVLITAVDTTIVVLALPTMMADIHAPLSEASWVILSYLLVITLLSTQVGRIGDMFGRVRIYQLGFLIFILGSLFCGLAANSAEMILFRIVQGVGGAFVSANSGAVIADTFPPQLRGRAYGYNSIGWNLGAIIGILLGGFITTYWSWRWIFFINVPVGGFAFALGVRILRDRGTKIRQNLDSFGMILLGVGLFGVLLTLTRLSSENSNFLTWWIFILGITALIGFIWIERTQASPALDFSIFRISSLSFSLLASFFQSLGNFAVLFLLMMYLQGVRGLSPLQASLLLVPGYLVGSAMGPLSGRLTDRMGAIVPATGGLVAQMMAILLYAQLGTSTALWWVTVGSLINGVGSGLFFPANNAAVMKVAPSGVYGIVSGMLRTFANIGMVMSFAVAMFIAAQSIPQRFVYAIFVGTTKLTPHLTHSFDTGIHNAFYGSIIMMVLAAISSSLRRRHTTQITR